MLNNNINRLMSESSSNKNQESKELESKEPEKLILRIRSPSETAYLNAKSHASDLASDFASDFASDLASDLNQLIEPELEVYLTPSMLSHDEHSDLEATSPKLKFGDIKIHEYKSLSPLSTQSVSPNQNNNKLCNIKKETNPSTPRMK